ncbi:MAG: glycoside hydrolase family 9 protein [Agriterribacter sp.]
MDSMKLLLNKKLRIVMRVILLAELLCSFTCFAQPAIQLNQVGYYPGSVKYAVITNPANEDSFYIVNIQNNKLVFSGKLSETRKSQFSDTRTRIADFSPLISNGEYKLLTGNVQSASFKISSHVFDELSKAVVKGYYYQRVSMPLTAKYAGKWSRAAGHKDDSVLIHPSAAGKKRPAGMVIASPGGWYDAGDYNKYIVNSGITMGTLLAAYEDFPEYYRSLSLNIPESGNDVPDILDEILYNLRWMLTMQDPNDGGVYNKCTNAKFDSAVMPGVTKAPRYVVQKGTAATLDFAAVMAQAARVYSKFPTQLPGLSDSCLKAALYAWQWCVANPAAAYNQTEMNKQFSPAVTTGPYGDKYFEDEWFWAAVELTATTGNPLYIQSNQVSTDIELNIPWWSKVNMLGVYTALKNETTFSGTKLETTKLKNELIAFADQLTAGGNAAFKTVMGQSQRDFIWGSNSVALNQGMLLLKTYRLAKSPKHLSGAVSNLDYILGRNATGYCFVTGFGKKSPMHIHHRPSQADGITAPVPGLLAAGPNPGRQDKCHYPFTETETSYSDNDCSYASNEIAINWNAPLVYVVGALEALHK